jgi:RNA polymerase sigma-70 factor (ECF subfamily)
LISATISQASTTTYSSFSDEELASHSRIDDMGAFDELVRRHWAGMNRFLLGYLPAGLSEDVAQETFLRAHRKIGQYDEKRPFAPWLFTIGRRLALNAIRSERRRREIPLEGSLKEDKPEDKRTSFSPLWQLAKDKLSPDAYGALRLHYAEDLTIEEVAHSLGKGKIATKVMLHRARTKLAGYAAQLKKKINER